jgi:hypothetical protein
MDRMANEGTLQTRLYYKAGADAGARTGARTGAGGTCLDGSNHRSHNEYPRVTAPPPAGFPIVFRWPMLRRICPFRRVLMRGRGSRLLQMLEIAWQCFVKAHKVYKK